MRRGITIASWTVVVGTIALAGCEKDEAVGFRCSEAWPCGAAYVRDMATHYCVPDPDGGDVRTGEDVADGSVPDGSEDAPADTPPDVSSDAPSDVSSDAPPDRDFCTNEGDFAIVTSADLDETEEGEQTVTSAAQGCGLGCLADAEPQVCSVTCIVDATGVTADCAGCYGEVVKCSIENCLVQCPTDPSSDACRQCQTEFCLEEFHACTGL